MSTIKRKPPQAVTEAERDEGKVLIEQDGGMDVYMCVCNEHRRKCVNLPTDYPPSRPTDPSPFQTDHAQTVALGAIHRLRHHPPPHPLSLPLPIHNSPPQHTQYTTTKDNRARRNLWPGRRLRRQAPRYFAAAGRGFDPPVPPGLPTVGAFFSIISVCVSSVCFL